MAVEPLQHIYYGDGDPNGVVSAADAGAHYCDIMNMTFWLSGATFNGQTEWHLQQDGGVFTALGAGEEYAEGRHGSFVVPNGFAMTFAGDPSRIYSNVQMTVEDGVAFYSSPEESLVQIRPIYGAGRLILITPVFQPASPI